MKTTKDYRIYGAKASWFLGSMTDEFSPRLYLGRDATLIIRPESALGDLFRESLDE